MGEIGFLGASLMLGIAAVGSGIGICVAGSAAVGAWKRCYLSNKPAPFILTVFAGAPLTQTIYGFLTMQSMITAAANGKPGLFLLGLGIASGAAIGLSAVVQGMVGAAAADAQGETGKGFAQYMMVVGLCETVALFTMVFSMIVCGS